MGQRANLVIVRDGQWSLYYDHWCANVLDVELFWGPELATHFIEQRPPLADRNDWLDEVWAEGGAVIDHDHRVLLWFGGEDILYDVLDRRVLLELLQTQWPGWEIRWACGGIAELGAYVNVAPALFLDPKGWLALSDRFAVREDYPDLNDVLLTVRHNGISLGAKISGDVDSLGTGPELLPFFIDSSRYTSTTWKDHPPKVGVHVDVDARSLSYWSARPVVCAEQRVTGAWPGWKVIWLRDQLEQHMGLAGIRVELPKRNPTTVRLAQIERMRRNVDRKASNLARELADKLPAASINPATDEARGSYGPQAAKLEILKVLEAKVRAGFFASPNN